MKLTNNSVCPAVGGRGMDISRRGALRACGLGCLVTLVLGTAGAGAKDLAPVTATRPDGMTVAKFAQVGTGTWTIPTGVTAVELLVVGGGGGGSGSPQSATGGGGGGGGVIYQAKQAVAAGAVVAVTVGKGGGGGDPATAGGASAFGTWLAEGGQPGTTDTGGASGAPTSHPGGAEIGGGGGAGQAGASPWHANAKGGDGVRCAITGRPTSYGGGGGTMYSGAGGAGGGGAGSPVETTPGANGSPNKGGGGGGGRKATGGDGGSGVVIVAYRAPGGPPSHTNRPAVVPLDGCNVAWDTPGGNALHSMPLGNGDVGVNAWVETNGDLVFYVSKTNAWDENARLCKIGKVRVRFDPPLPAADDFQQELILKEGIMHVTAGRPGADIRVRLWVDADHAVVRVVAESGAAVNCRADVELWRLRERPFAADDSHSGNGLDQLDYKATITPDVVVDSPTPAVIWYHRNKRSIYDAVLKTENLGSLVGKFPDPLLNHTFGASLRGTDMIQAGPKALRSKQPAKRHELAVCVLAEKSPTPAAWHDHLLRSELTARQSSAEQSRHNTAAWWARFWNHSYVYVDETPDDEDDGVSPVMHGYVLQRFITAAAGRGPSPIKFNGSIFNVEAKPGASPETPDGDPDWRRWGGNYWFQNTRLAYWPLLASGNTDMMKPFFQMYLDALPLSMARAKSDYQMDGAAVFPETMYFWGLPNLGDYGLNNRGPEMTSSYIRRHFNNGIELTAVMLEYYHHTRDDKFVRETLLPLAEPLMTFFERRWPKRDAAGKIVFDQSQALETYQSATNPMPDVAGLHYVLPRLLALPANLTGNDPRARWDRMLKQLPPMPVGEANGKKFLRPAAEHGGPANFENPELYAVFPFKLFGVGSKDLDLGRTSFAKRANRQNRGWCKDSIQAACLGLGDEAARLVAARARDINKNARFPAFWGPNFDWIPDQDHGSNLVNTLQLMLLQYETAATPTYNPSQPGKIYILPAWPNNWSASFKLHAPLNTTVEGEVRAGKLIRLNVTPKSRLADVVGH